MFLFNAIPCEWKRRATALIVSGMAIGLAVLSPTAVGAEEEQSLVGESVTVIFRGAELTLEGKTLRILEVGDNLRVEKVDGKLLGIEGGGFVERKHVVPYEDAIEYFTDLIEAAPTTTHYIERGRCWASRDKLVSAIADFSEAIRLDSESSEAYLSRGQLYHRQENLINAVADYTRAIELESDSPKAAVYLYRAMALIDQGEYVRAVEDLGEVISHSPNYAGAYNLRATLLSTLGDYDRAIADYDRVLELLPDHGPTYYSRGGSRLLRGEYDKALADFDEAIRLDPESASAWNNRAWLLATCSAAEHRNGQQAISDATRACELTDWKEHFTLDSLAAAYAEAGDFEKAVEWQQKAVEIGPADEIDDLRSRLDLYEAGQPYREPSPSNADTPASTAAPE